MIRTLATKAAKLGVNWSAIKLAFFLGCIVGMVVMSIVITACFTAPDAVEILVGRVMG